MIRMSWKILLKTTKVSFKMIITNRIKLVKIRIFIGFLIKSKVVRVRLMELLSNYFKIVKFKKNDLGRYLR